MGVLIVFFSFPQIPPCTLQPPFWLGVADRKEKGRNKRRIDRGKRRATGCLLRRRQHTCTALPPYSAGIAHFFHSIRSLTPAEVSPGFLRDDKKVRSYRKANLGGGIHVFPFHATPSRVRNRASNERHVAHRVDETPFKALYKMWGARLEKIFVLKGKCATFKGIN